MQCLGILEMACSIKKMCTLKKEILKLSTQKSRLFRQVALFEYPVNKFIILL